jgi:hypothetical protein
MRTRNLLMLQLKYLACSGVIEPCHGYTCLMKEDLNSNLILKRE